MHCSEEELLAHFDGELGFFAGRRVRRHLESCWRCRTRLASLEEEIRHLMVATDEWRFPSPEWQRDALSRLTSGMREHEASLQAKPRSPFRRIATAGAIAAAVAIAAVAGWRTWTGNRPAEPRPTQVIAQVTSTEQSTYAKPVHQTFSLRIAEIRPSTRAVNTQLQVWADRENGRFASRLSSSDGVLRHALWRPAANQEFVFDPAESRQVVERRQHRGETESLASLAENGLDAAQIEASFMHWMERRPWTAIAFSSDLSLWTSADGAVAKAERIPLPDGRSAIRLTVERRMRRAVAILSVELDSSSLLPRLQTIRFESPDRSVEVRLETVAIQTMKRSEITAAVFHPDPGLAPGPIEGSVAMLRQPVEAPAPKLPAQDRLPLWDPDELRANYALHQSGACMGESVRISEEANGVNVLRIGSAVTSPAGTRLDAVLSALAELRDAGPPHEGRMALRHAWALRFQVEQLRTRRLRGLNGASLDLIDAMMHDHLAGIRSGLAELGIQPANVSKLDGAGVDWRKAAGPLFDALKQAATQPSGAVDEALALSIVRHLEEFSRGMDTEIRQDRKVLLESGGSQ